MYLRSLTPTALATAIVLCLNSMPAIAVDKLPPTMAGTIGQPTGQIAFMRDKNIWIMDAHGGHQMVVTEVGNADGRMSWSPDGKKIAFTRSGNVNMQGPDNLGGKHKIYDIFVAYVDSALNGKTLWWYRLTDQLGSRDPEWQSDETILFYRDMNAREADAFLPNYQICTMDSAGGHFEVLRPDWQNMTEFLTSPTMSPSGEIAFVHLEKPSQGMFRPRGIAKLHRDRFLVSMDSVRSLSGKMEGFISPGFSPDGKWIAYLNNSMSEPGVYISPADFSARYLVFAPPPGTTLQSFAPSFSPDSKWLTFSTRDGSIWICDITGNGLKRLSGPGMDGAPAWSKTAK